eukprot:TRINITY_DN773022_c0_g1_i1.p1 TRINITY_DN773022_c0_g1~~TRINITY_DN773022_c0_g1_i1.p1  ORF type:complete len:245 (-),score=58.97 TRINITY_DN773022_c0_g1_i1:191-925(-)
MSSLKELLLEKRKQALKQKNANVTDPMAYYKQDQLYCKVCGDSPITVHWELHRSSNSHRRNKETSIAAFKAKQDLLKEKENRIKRKSKINVQNPVNDPTVHAEKKEETTTQLSSVKSKSKSKSKEIKNVPKGFYEVDVKADAKARNTDIKIEKKKQEQENWLAFKEFEKSVENDLLDDEAQDEIDFENKLLLEKLEQEEMINRLEELKTMSKKRPSSSIPARISRKRRKLNKGNKIAFSEEMNW